ncbi:TspO/MBR family protein [Priestia flexa]|uniref:TspO/MBR family protein n=1 Tax=Priestia flexa TaxID=86664 RepID=A0ABU4J6R5_9BACI|nr:TspO/MBR family protein [Priestia flexa]MBY6085862.1 tryptophan-rich sensory protein [Priestia flexa]MCA1201215.1 tryptophan-rich sensory protein [Priestia flexa]MCG7312456.1 tryptophan-rich sensory protein [Priestia flexa]MCM3066324.1 tryptophan-rich sensory protein [Priestia flexa]MCP1189094.1 tryptophan-rich sensory protein [Priestia flexa]
MANFRFYSILNAIGLVLVLIVNYLANALPIGGQTTGEVSDSVPTLFTPAGYAFAIWGLIYTLLIIWIIRQFIAREDQKEIYAKIGIWFFISCLLNSAWIFIFQYRYFTLALLVIVLFLVTLMIIYSIIQNSRMTTWFMRLPISIYIGWVSVATIVNVFVVFQANGIETLFGLGEQTWAIIMLVVGGILGVLFTRKNRDIAYSLVFIWAFIAISVKQSAYSGIVTTVWVVVVILALNIIVQLIRNYRK